MKLFSRIQIKNFDTMLERDKEVMPGSVENTDDIEFAKPLAKASCIESIGVDFGSC